MTITLDEKLEKDLKTSAEGAGVTPEEFALEVLRRSVSLPSPHEMDFDLWKERLRKLAKPLGVPMPGTTYSREEIYE